MEKIKNCPFCGRADELSVEETDPPVHDCFPWRVLCGACLGSVYDGRRDLAIAAWNARAGNGEPIGFANLWEDGSGSIHARSDIATERSHPRQEVAVPVYRHPSPAIDAAEAERLVDAYGSAIYHESRANDTASGQASLAARRALLECVTGGKG